MGSGIQVCVCVAINKACYFSCHSFTNKPVGLHYFKGRCSHKGTNMLQYVPQAMPLSSLVLHVELSCYVPGLMPVSSPVCHVLSLPGFLVLRYSRWNHNLHSNYFLMEQQLNSDEFPPVILWHKPAKSVKNVFAHWWLAIMKHFWLYVPEDAMVIGKVHHAKKCHCKNIANTNFVYHTKYTRQHNLTL